MTVDPRPNLKVRSVTFGFKHRGAMGGSGVIENDFTRKIGPEDEKTLIQWGRQILKPDFYFSSIIVLQNSQCDVHADTNNLGESAIITVGKHTGGGLWVHGSGPCLCHNTVHYFDGKTPHTTMPFDGERYSVVFYTRCESPNAQPKVREELEKKGYRLPPRGRAVTDTPTSNAVVAQAKKEYQGFLLTGGMFKTAGINRKQLHDALKIMGTLPYRNGGVKTDLPWSPKNPTQNYCYVVSEFVLHYAAPEGTKAWRLNDFPHSETIHVFLEWPDGAIVDLTADQFGDTVIPYHDTTRQVPHLFMPGGERNRGGPSRRARILAVRMGHDTEGHIDNEGRVILKSDAWPFFCIQGGLDSPELKPSYNQKQALTAFQTLLDRSCTFEPGKTNWTCRDRSTPADNKLGSFQCIKVSAGQEFANFFHWDDRMRTDKIAGGKKNAFNLLDSISSGECAERRATVEKLLSKLQPHSEPYARELKRYIRRNSTAYDVTQYPAHIAKTLVTMFNAQ